MAKDKKLTINHYHGENLIKISKNPDALFPLYVKVRYTSTKTFFKSISAKHYESLITYHGTFDTHLKKYYIESRIDALIKKDINLIFKVKMLYELLFKKPFDVKFLTSDDFKISLFAISANYWFELKLIREIPRLLLNIDYKYQTLIDETITSIGASKFLRILYSLNTKHYYALIEDNGISKILELYEEIKDQNITLLDLYFLNIPKDETLLQEFRREFELIITWDSKPLYKPYIDFYDCFHIGYLSEKI